MSKKTVSVSNTLVLRRTHPRERVSYSVPGMAGLVVIDTRIFANGKAPKTITVDCDLAVPDEPKKKADTTAQA